MREFTFEIMLLFGVGVLLYYKGSNIFTELYNKISNWSLNTIPVSNTLQNISDSIFTSNPYNDILPSSSIGDGPYNIAQLESMIQTAKQNTSYIWNIPTEIIVGIIRTESSGNPNAVSSAGAKGLMQIMPPTWIYVTNKFGYPYTNLFDPIPNIIVGCSYLQLMYDNLNDWNAAIQAYTLGLGGYTNGLRASDYLSMVYSNAPNYN